MKKIRELFPWDDRTRLMFSAAAVGVILLAAILLPLAFRTDGRGAAGQNQSKTDKFSLFAGYWERGPEECGFSISRPESLSEETKERCETVMRTLMARCINDQALDYAGPTGSEYTVISDVNGEELQLCRMWLEQQGDWQNWMDVCFDAETGQVYYLYLSRECLHNQSDYAEQMQVPDLRGLADGLASEYGWSLRWMSGDSDGSAAAVFRTGDSMVCYQIDCRAFDALVDIKFCCK